MADIEPHQVSISPLLKRLAYPTAAQIDVTAQEIAAAFCLLFDNKLSIIQGAALLTLLHSTGKDTEPDVIACCAERMRDAASQVNKEQLKAIVKQKGKPEGAYKGGLCDIVGTGGDGHSTFNISTTSSILASSLLIMAKHGNRAQTSASGAADVLAAISPENPHITGMLAEQLPEVYKHTNYAFLFAPNFHPGMKYAMPLRRGLGIRTIFNLLGPLANPVHWALEGRIVGVAKQSLGPIFVEALKLSGAKKAMVVCGLEDLDELSIAGKTNCWKLTEVANPAYKGENTAGDGEISTSDDDAEPKTIATVEHFQLEAADFGLPSHPLTEVFPGRQPRDNAEKLMDILSNKLPREDPILDFVLMNTAALLVVSGICEAETSDMGFGDDGKVITERGPGGGRWKEGVRRARWAIESGQALKNLKAFLDITGKLGAQS